MKQYRIENNNLILEVKKGPLFIRAVILLVAIILFMAPVVGLGVYIASGKGFHIAFVIGFLLFGLFGFYLLRVYLWNTFGKEVIRFEKQAVTYYADYGWFKDGQVTKSGNLFFTAMPVGYEEDRKATLAINVGKEPIICVTKMPQEELEELVRNLNAFRIQGK